ncbi:MAG: hypothetical protein LBD10_02755 [Desulfobulbus sp.]|uniref:hypothetical protein n=1 Tax=Desulfobulbus sp. TaxID=895 RepID=UPI002844D570|nr:hypothetical protein [Desulfobulbus sp.]MDR2549113.1 hypothetical protein [Desulfobulbus sp.]
MGQQTVASGVLIVFLVGKAMSIPIVCVFASSATVRDGLFVRIADNFEEDGAGDKVALTVRPSSRAVLRCCLHRLCR